MRITALDLAHDQAPRLRGMEAPTARRVSVSLVVMRTMYSPHGWGKIAEWHGS